MGGDELQVKNDVLTAIILALLERSGGVLVLSRVEIEKAWSRSLKYEMHTNSILVEFA